MGTKFHTVFDPADDAGLKCTAAERRTKSEFASECDINLIMARYRKTGVLPESARSSAARFGDFSQVPTFADMQDKIIAANDLFAALPAMVRRQFGNDPHEFLAASSTKEGQALLVKLGLGKPTPPVASSSAPVQGAPAGTEPAPAPDKGAKPKADSTK